MISELFNAYLSANVIEVHCQKRRHTKFSYFVDYRKLLSHTCRSKN